MTHTLNQSQQEAVGHQGGSMLVVAGAGTGKTRVITERIARLVNEGSKPESIVALTFTEKAAQEMQDRLAEVIGYRSMDVNVTTFNGYGERLLRRFAAEIGLSGSFYLLSETQQTVFLREHLDKLQLDYYAPVGNPVANLAAIADVFSRLKQELVTPEHYQEFSRNLVDSAGDEAHKLEAARHTELARAYAAYTKLALQEGVIDYDDQIYLLVQLLRKRPNVANRLQSEIEYLLVDEYQDTNKMQAGLLRLLTGQKQNIMAVGDDDQAIYAFRGASIDHILGFSETYQDAKQVTLIENYRSTQQILDAAYRLIQQNNPDRLEIKYGLDKKLHAQQEGVSPPTVRSFARMEDESRWIARDVSERLKKGESISEMAVLARNNRSAQRITDALEDTGVPVVLLGQTKALFREPDVVMLIAALESVCDPHDEEALYRTLTSELFGHSSLTLRDYVATAKREHSQLSTALGEIDEFKEALGIVESWREQIPRLSVGKLLFTVLEDTKLIERLLGRASDDPSVDARIYAINEFFGAIGEFERTTRDQSAPNFLLNLPALEAAGERIHDVESEAGMAQSVSVMTMHRSKGLEYDTVYLYDISQQSIPSQLRGGEIELPEELVPGGSSVAFKNEERRLMYVAMTRARKNLIITWSADHGGKLMRKPSQFLAEAFGEEPSSPPELPKAKWSTIGPATSIEKGGRSQLPDSMFMNGQLVLSSSQITCYRDCPAEFRLRYIISPPQAPSSVLMYGNAIHGAIKAYYDARMAERQVSLVPTAGFSEDDLLSVLEQSWSSVGFSSLAQSDRAYKQAEQTLRYFYAREQSTARTPSAVEKSFKVYLSDIGVVLRGRIDAVYDDEQGLEIRDYKTGGDKVTDKDKADKRSYDSEQLSYYALAWNEIYGRVPDVLTLDFVDQGLLGESRRSPRRLETARRYVADAAKGILGGRFEPSSDHRYCRHVDYGF